MDIRGNFYYTVANTLGTYSFCFSEKSEGVSKQFAVMSSNEFFICAVVRFSKVLWAFIYQYIRVVASEYCKT